MLGSHQLVVLFSALPAVLVAVFVAAVQYVWRPGSLKPPPASGQVLLRTMTAATLWLGLWAAASLSGLLSRWELRPPPLVLAVPAIAGVSIWIARSETGRRLSELPVEFLIGFHAFRFPLELCMVRAAREGVMPPQMSMAGYNPDVLTGILALGLLIVGVVLRRRQQALPRWIVMGFNLVGTALLLNVLVIAIASTPLFAAFGPERVNTWVTHMPYVYLPAVMVLLAVLGHLLLYRRLFESREWCAPAESCRR
jgi:nitrate reductase gamma subunit